MVGIAYSAIGLAANYPGITNNYAKKNSYQ